MVATQSPVTPAPPPFWRGVLEDIHVNASGLVMFTCAAAGIFLPEHKPQFDQLMVVAGTYLFASAKNKTP